MNGHETKTKRRAKGWLTLLHIRQIMEIDAYDLTDCAVIYLTDPHVYASIVLSNIEIKVFILYLHVPTFGKFAFEPVFCAVCLFSLIKKSAWCIFLCSENKQTKEMKRSTIV